MDEAKNIWADLINTAHRMVENEEKHHFDVRKYYLDKHRHPYSSFHNSTPPITA